MHTRFLLRMRPRHRTSMLAAAAVLLSGASTTTLGAVIYNEPLQADLSDNYLAPTPLVVAPGSNEFFGACEGDDGVSIDRDYYSLTIPAGHALTALNLNFYESLDFAAFLGISAGAAFSVGPDDATFNDPLGWMLMTPQEVGTDVLPLMGTEGQMFTPPLPAGTYTFWAQQMGEYTEYALELVIAPIPSAPSAALWMLALAGASRPARPQRSLIAQ